MQRFFAIGSQSLSDIKDNDMCILSKSAETETASARVELRSYYLVNKKSILRKDIPEKKKQIIPKMGKKLQSCRSLQHDSSVELFNSFADRHSKIVTEREREIKRKSPTKK